MRKRKNKTTRARASKARATTRTRKTRATKPATKRTTARRANPRSRTRSRVRKRPATRRNAARPTPTTRAPRTRAYDVYGRDVHFTLDGPVAGELRLLGRADLRVRQGEPVMADVIAAYVRHGWLDKRARADGFTLVEHDATPGAFTVVEVDEPFLVIGDVAPAGAAV